MSADIKLTRLAECAGCGAKVGAGVLAQLLDGLPTRTDERLLVGYDTSDDASVYRLSDQLALVQTVDFFPPIVDDPFRFGQIAAANAFSDVYAMGGEPKLALNLLCGSPEMDDEAVRAVLRGGSSPAATPFGIWSPNTASRSPVLSTPTTFCAMTGRKWETF